MAHSEPGWTVVRSKVQALACGPVMMAAAMFGVSGQAAAQIVSNGDFSSTANNQTSTYTLDNGATSGNNYLPDWGIGIPGPGPASNCLIANDSFTASCTSNKTLGQTPGYSPDGGNFISLSDSSNISQSVSLTQGQRYAISFDEAGAQPGGASGDSDTVYWMVTLGSTTLFDGTTDSLIFAGNSSGGWTTDSTSFTAGTSASETLTFTAYANFTGPGMGAQSPVVLLDSVSIAGVATPEPATLSVFGIGLAGLAAARRRRSRLH